MSHLRDTVLLTQGSKDSSTPSGLQESFLMEQLPRELQCQFILKPSRLAAAQQLSGELLLLLRGACFEQKFLFLKKVSTKAEIQTSSQMRYFFFF